MRGIHAPGLRGDGRAALGPVRSSIQHFREEYLQHIREKRCPFTA